MQIVKKIRVLECIRQGQVGGGESHLLSLVENLDRTRFEVVVLSFTDGPMVRELKKQGVETHVIYTERPFDFTKWRQVKRLIRSCSIDIIHAHGTRAASNILWAARSLNIPLIYTIHGWSFHDDQNALIRNIRVLGERYIVHRSNLNISVSESNKRTGIRYLKNLHSIVINNGIDQRKFSAQSVHQDVRKELGISNEALVVLFVARFTHQKQPHLLIESFSKALAQVPNLHLLMVGDGDLKLSSVEMVKSLGVTQNVHFLPFRSDVPDILAAGDIFVLPSLWEGLPIALLEAMSMGKAIIASDVDGSNEVVKDGYNGKLVKPGDKIGLADAIVELSLSAQVRNQYQMNAVLTVKEKFNAKLMTKQVEHVYVEILSNKISNFSNIPHGI